LPSLYDHSAFVELRQTDGIRRRMQVWLEQPVPTEARVGPIQIAGIPGRWVPHVDLILLERSVTPEMATVIEDMCRESVRRGRLPRGYARGGLVPDRLLVDDEIRGPGRLPAPVTDPRIPPIYWGSEAVVSGGHIYHTYPGYPRQSVDWTWARVDLAPPKAPPRAPRCACGDRNNKRWEHHSGGCTYLDPAVEDYLDEGPADGEEEDED
jgi:hypothetical protein